PFRAMDAGDDRADNGDTAGGSHQQGDGAAAVSADDLRAAGGVTPAESLDGKSQIVRPASENGTVFSDGAGRDPSAVGDQADDSSERLTGRRRGPSTLVAGATA